MNDSEWIVRRELHVFYVLDSSRNMCGSPITALNHKVEKSISALQKLTDCDARLKIAALKFNSDCKWITEDGPEDLENYKWKYISAGGDCNLGCALDELNSKLSRKGFLSSMIGVFWPIIIFVTDGHPDDCYQDSLVKLQDNAWFRHASKIGLVVSDTCDTDLLAQITGTHGIILEHLEKGFFEHLLWCRGKNLPIDYENKCWHPVDDDEEDPFEALGYYDKIDSYLLRLFREEKNGD